VLQMASGNIPSLLILDLRYGNLGSAEFAERAPTLYRNTSIKELDTTGIILTIRNLLNYFGAFFAATRPCHPWFVWEQMRAND
jgi:hypothetical protein